MTLNYVYEEEKKEKKKINKFAIINCTIGLPTIAFLILFLVKGFLSDYLPLVYSAIGLLGLGILYSIYKLIKR